MDTLRLIVFGIVIVVVALVIAYNHTRKDRFVRVTAKIIEVKESEGPDSTTLYTPVYEYYVFRQRYTLEGKTTDVDDRHVGDTRDVICKANEPENLYVTNPNSSAAKKRKYGTIILIFGVVFVALAVLL